MKTGTIMSGIAVFIWSIFMGVTAIAIGVGAAFPPLNQIAAPFICPNGQMTYTEETSNPLPGTTYTQIGWYCVDKQTGAKTELDIFPMTLYSGVFYGLLLFVVILAIWYFANRRKASSGFPADRAILEQASRSRSQAQQFYSSLSNFDEGTPQTAERGGDSEAVLTRMQTLKELREANLISEAEYEQKRAEILRNV